MLPGAKGSECEVYILSLLKKKKKKKKNGGRAGDSVGSVKYMPAVN